MLVVGWWCTSAAGVNASATSIEIPPMPPLELPIKVARSFRIIFIATSVVGQRLSSAKSICLLGRVVFISS
jgi:hypothetical protein